MKNFEQYKDDDDFVNFDQKIVHIHKVQTRGRKCITMIKGIDEQFDLKKIVKFCKRNFKCHAHIREEGKETKKSKEDRKNKEQNDAEGAKKEEIVFSGDQIAQIKKFLIYMGITIEDNIRVHGN